MRGRAAVVASFAVAPALLAAALAWGARVSVNDTGHLRLLKASGSRLIEEGPASGTLPGSTRATLDVGGDVSATFVIRTRSGSIRGRGGAALHSSARYASFGGWLRVTGGTGRYAHAHGSGHLYGVIERRSDAVTVQTIGKLYF
jgi:hypothetical protein